MEFSQNKNKKQEDKTFNTLKRIQSLLKKESALKKLCKKIIFIFFNYEL
jgi:hypothetical protein